MSKRAVLYLMAGIICAGVALILGRRHLGTTSGSGQEVKFTRIMLAVDDIEFGEGLVLMEGEGEGNVKFVKWPEEIALEGAIEEAESFKQRDTVAAVRLVRHQPVLERLIIDRQDFIKPGMYVEMITVDRRLVSAWKPGMKVDIFKVGEREAEKFIQCAKIYAVGEFPPEKLIGEEQPKAKKPGEVTPNVFVLLPTEFKEAVIETRLYSRLELSPADRDCGDAPELVVREIVDVRALVTASLSEGELLLRTGRPAEALTVFESILAEYPTVPEAKRAADLAQQCKSDLAEEALKKAEAAFAAEQYAGCIELCEALREDYPGNRSRIS